MSKPTADHTAPDWVLCGGCHAVIYQKQLARSLGVCPQCGHYAPLTAPDRLALIADPGSLVPLEFTVDGGDPLVFTDSLPYPRRVADARAATGLAEAAVCARLTIGGTPTIAAVMDFRFLGGSLGGAVGELITLSAETALAERLPLLLVTASGGVRMQEGVIGLMQMVKTTQALHQLDEAGLLTVCLIADPTYGGVAASFAMLGDIIVAEPGARLGFAGPRVIAQTIGQELPPGFQTAEFLLERGFIDQVCPRSAIRDRLGRLLSIATRRHDGDLSSQRAPEDRIVIREPEQLADRPAWDAVRRARHIGRPTTSDYLRLILDDFEELRGDRLGGDCRAIIGGVGRLGGESIVAIGHEKGHNAAELAAHGYGMPGPAGYRKAGRLLRLAAKWGLPVVTLVDTPGAHPGLEAELQGQATAIAENLRLMGALPVPVVTVITGEGCSGGALAIAVADRVLVMENGFYTVISPEGCAAILWRDSAEAPAAAEALRLDARSLLQLGVVDGVVPEPPGGAETDHVSAAAAVRTAVLAELADLAALDSARLVANRRRRFRAFGGRLDQPGHDGNHAVSAAAAELVFEGGLR
ncbi:acetyl-CoA carboxylase carboxyl transferase subunit beta [Allocatelliglobosispora scoriae]|uniref:Multifunctional fusion protein n=1 Tax=Allocatelliglobosispora scoriae TaxID=643052 RepID=A0A841BYV5_9ACTN|nr:acetyl-CoA carboxylase carboxyltransferase subunit alpha/beta [Allocatelliglobosispora scoriae]MBB5872855.1 acetyl-CoA carboxylase carboxyl transferase subunit beta [Allocatelliglobosispora scoriae]